MLERIEDQYKVEQALIFCRTNFDCDNLERFMLSLDNTTQTYRGKKETGKEGAYSCVVLGGARSMEERRRALQGFKDGDVRFLICTDVAARGIDISGLPCVINMTLPDKAEDYIHRSGRVGRADALGLSISIVSKVPEKVWFCSVKGYKPWLQPKPADTKTQDQGGHTIWYDEQKLLGEIENRLGGIVARMGPDLSLPPEVSDRLKGGAGGGEAYGQAKGGGNIKEVSEHLQAIRGSVESLAALEWQAQTSFNLLLRNKWGASGREERQKQQLTAT
ncbi:P-loop containing nucleoside triphosphate hydrolase protein [Dunaliella salina]|uniref:P-loop containing nucleoside triphosphate hydrolase protein n=1 Tax=Dunaliella salina TaxID=3046 RepID=A0ABQ7H6J2_DUNSA|nr:P-loop containing nucleoside triphosphate hydrolase protein [Dunaliella salina]|eukprot:KAF5842464.1 P-loop containing nucleoside triphosphate hydrolase protein [Dunaliella salina]